MIIKSLYCKNFMKFRELDLREIPDKGLIGIIGENEAGKSTIGEAISFGLFGKCTRGDVQHLDDIIFWGEEEGFVQVQVKFGSECFILSRNFSTNGTSLSIRNETLGTELDETRIEEFSHERLRLSFKEFRYSSYVAQKELAIIQSQKEDRLDVINSMLGLNRLDNTTRFLEAEVDVSRSRVDEVSDVLEKLRSSLAEINEELAEKQVLVDEIEVHEAEKDENAGRIADSEKQIELLNTFEETGQRHRLLGEKISILEDNIKKQEEKIKAFDTIDSEFEELKGQLELARKRLAEKEKSKVDLDKQLKECEQREKRRVEYEKLETVCESLRKSHETKQESLASIAETSKMLAEERSEIEGQLAEAESEFGAEKNALAELDVLKKKRQESEKRKDQLEKNAAEAAEIRTKLANGAEITALVEKTKQEIEDSNSSWRLDESRVKTELSKAEDRLVELGQRTTELNDAHTINSEKAIQAKRRGKEKLFWALFLFSSVCLIGLLIATKVMTYLSLAIVPQIFLILAIVCRGKTNALQRRLNEEAVSIQDQKDEIDREHKLCSENKLQLEKELAEIVRKSTVLQEVNLTDRPKIEEGLAKARELPEKQLAHSLMTILDFLKENDIDGPLHEYHGSLEETLQKLERGLQGLKEVQQTYLELSNAVLKLETRRESIPTLEQKIDGLKKRLSRKLTEEKKLADSREKLEAETGRLDQEITETESQLEGLAPTDMEVIEKTELQATMQENSGNIDGLKERILKTKEEINSLKRQKDDRRQLLEDKDQLQKELDRVKGEFDRIGKQLRDIEFSQEKLNGLREELKNYNLQMVEILETIARKKTLLERFQDAESKKKQVSAKIQEVEQEEKQLGENMLYFPEVIKLYGQTRENIIKKIKPQIERYFSTYLPKLTNNRYKKVSLQEDFSIRIFSDEKNDYVPVKNLSGGTEDQVLLMLRLAFSKALFPATQEGDGNPAFHQFLFLDEPISSFDQKRQNAFIELLRIMEKIYQQIFVISHIGELENKMDYFIKAEASSNVLDVERL